MAGVAKEAVVPFEQFDNTRVSLSAIGFSSPLFSMPLRYLEPTRLPIIWEEWTNMIRVRRREVLRIRSR
ncbi:hypothetical protein LB505_011981 [Fusarium chuoi]|nr:hypothetical protein LB505_011981 [Fusarium chuoi]